MQTQHDHTLATYLQRGFALLLDIILVPLTLFIGYFIWWLIVLGKGQTPGKQILGIRVIKDTGEDCGWGIMFVREFIVKFLLAGFLAGVTLGIYPVVNYLWPLFDKDNKALHDKIISTLVVRN